MYIKKINISQDIVKFKISDRVRLSKIKRPFEKG